MLPGRSVARAVGWSQRMTCLRLGREWARRVCIFANSNYNDGGRIPAGSEDSEKKESGNELS